MNDIKAKAWSIRDIGDRRMINVVLLDLQIKTKYL
jgi:hypothetical protein